MNAFENSTTSGLLAPSGHLALDVIGLDVFTTSVESARGFIVNALAAAGMLGDVDGVHQRIRETAWRRAHTFDPSLGSFGSFVHGIAKRVLTETVRNKRRAARRLATPSDEIQATESSDPLIKLVSRCETTRLITHVADASRPEEWELAVQLGVTECTVDDIARQNGTSVRYVRAARQRVAATAWTVRSALRAADNQQLPTQPVIRDCLPSSGGLRALADYLPNHLHEADLIANRLQLSVNLVRQRLPHARRLMTLAQTVIETETS
jgi:DNA-directed RNA polymerase specialized sigma24 family protein